MAALAVTTASICASTKQISPAARSTSIINPSSYFTETHASYFMGLPCWKYHQKNRKSDKIGGKVYAAATADVTSPSEEVKEYISGEFEKNLNAPCSRFTLPKWAEFDLGRAPIYWKTMNGLPPTSGEKLKLFYNPAATKLVPNEEFGIAFNGGFNQPIMCGGGEPRAMLCKTRGKADSPIYTIQICIPKHAMNLIFSFTNGTEWDGPYRLQFQVPKNWRNKPVDFFSEGLAEELSRDGACEKAIFPDTNIVVDRCAMIGNLTVEGGDRCELDLVTGCTDRSSSLYNPLANVDDGSCPPFSDSEE